MIRPWLPRLPQRRAPARPAPVPAPTALMAAELADRPFGFGGGGELTPVRVEPPAPQPKPFIIEPWPEEERRKAAEAAEPPPPMTAVEAMMNGARELGEVDFPQLEFGAPLLLGPLERPTLPPVDWEAVEREAIRENRRAERERALALLDEEETPSRHPPAKRGAA